MANLVEFLVKLNDMASGPLKQLGATGQNSFNKLSDSVNKFQGKMNTMGMNISQIDAKLNQLKATREISFDSRQIKRLNTEIDRLQGKKNRLEGVSSSGGGLLGFGLGFAALGLGKEIMQAGIGRQMDLTALQTLLGTDAGNRVNAQLLKFAKDSIYGNEVFNEGKLMAGSGVKAGNIMPILNMIGDIAMGDKERMKSIALAFSEASSTGHLNGRTELMMRTALFNPLESMAKMTGKSVGQLEKDMRKGGISIDMLVKSMEYATGPMGRWHNMMQKMQETPAGKWTAFTGTLRTLAGTIGLELLPALGGLTDFVTKIISNEDNLVLIGAGVAAMAASWGIYELAVKGAAAWTAILEGAISWPITVGAAVGLLVANFMRLDAMGPGQDWSWANTLRRTFEDVVYWAQSAWLHIESFFQRMYMIRDMKGPTDFWKMYVPTKADAAIDKLKNKHSWNRAMDLAGLDANGNKKSGLSPMDIAAGKYTGSGAGGGDVLGAKSGASITGGGVRSITINVAKFQDKTEIHTMGLKEGIHEVEEMIRDMFLRVTNSAATAIS